MKLIANIVVGTLWLQLNLGCQSYTEVQSPVMSDLLELQRSHVISESRNKQQIVDLFKNEIVSHFEFYGYGYRIEEIVEKWSVFEDANHLIFIGSVAKSDNYVYFFTLVYASEGEGRYKMVFQQIGKNTEGSYPDGIVPYKTYEDPLSLHAPTIDQLKKRIHQALLGFNDFDQNSANFHLNQVNDIFIKDWALTLSDKRDTGYLIYADLRFDLPPSEVEYAYERGYKFFYLVSSHDGELQVTNELSFGLLDAYFDEPTIFDFNKDGIDDLLIESRSFNGRRTKPDLMLYSIQDAKFQKQDSLSEYSCSTIDTSKSITTFTAYYDWEAGEGGADSHKYYVEYLEITSDLRLLSSRKIMTQMKYSNCEPGLILDDPNLRN